MLLKFREYTDKIIIRFKSNYKIKIMRTDLSIIYELKEIKLYKCFIQQNIR